jgi:hypothetical protein
VTVVPAVVTGVFRDELLPGEGVVHPADTTTSIARITTPINKTVFFMGIDCMSPVFMVDPGSYRLFLQGEWGNHSAG